MQAFINHVFLGAAVLAVGFAGCKKKDAENTEQPVETEQPLEEGKPTEAMPTTVEPTPAPEPTEVASAGSVEGEVVIEATHTPKKDGDPVRVKFSKITLVSANFDPANIEGGSAEFAIDLAGLDSGIPDRDKHLQSPDFLDVGSNATATIKVTDIKKDGDKYKAKMEATAHGSTASWDIGFAATQEGNSVSITLEHAFTRDDFKVGDAGGKVANDLKLLAKLKITKS